MKDIPSDLAAEYESGGTKLAHCLLVTRADGEVFGFTSTDHPVTVLGQLYEPGMDVTALVQNVGLAVNNLQVNVAYDETFVREDFLTGVWDNARWELFETDWSDPTKGSDTFGKFVTGNTDPGRLSCVVELRALSQFLNQAIGIVTSKTCRARLGDSACTVDLGPLTVTGTLTGVTSRQVVTDTGRTEVDEWFAEGTFTPTSGENVGHARRVRAYASDAFTFDLPFPYEFEVGDTYTAVAGCRKRIEDCRDKFDNILNMQAEPHGRGIDVITSVPEPDE